MGLGPGGREQSPGLGFAGLEGHSGPSQFPAEAYQAPVMGAFIEEQGLAPAHFVHRNRVRL